MFWGIGKDLRGLQVSFFINLKIAIKQCARFVCYTLLKIH